MQLTYPPTRGTLAWNWQDFVYTDGSNKGGSSPLGAAATHPASDTRIKILVTSTPPSHTMNRAELVGMDIGLQLGRTHLLTYSACSLRLIQGYLNCPSAYIHNIHRDTLLSITHTHQTRCDAGIRTHLGKIKAHNHSLGNDLAYTLANQVADDHPPDTTYTTCLEVTIGHWTWPYTLIPQTLGEPVLYRYTNLKADAHTYSTKHTHTPLSKTTKHGALLARAAEDGADLSFHKNTQPSQLSSSPTSKNSCGEFSAPAFLPTTPRYAAPFVANSLVTAT
jgi:ribonuclease HI